MISSKLILFFWFYLLLLDNSLGQKPLVEEAKNKLLFKRALAYGATYGGDIGLLASQWKQLLFQLVQAKRQVGLSRYQLTKFNESATEEVGPAIEDTYAHKVAELVAIRTEEIGTDQKYVDELEILKNEIAITMIIEMEETEEQFKTTNVKEKVKEAKEDGITDTDIKELLFAEFFGLGGGLSSIGAAASTADALLSSFREGMESILGRTYFEKLDGTYYEKLGIIEYGNGREGGVYVGDGGDADENEEEDEYFAPGGPGAPGAPPGGAPGGAAGGGDPPGGGGDPPEGPPDDKDDDEDEDDDKIDSEDIDVFFDQLFQELPEDLKNPIEGEPVAGPPQFSAGLVNNVTRFVNMGMNARTARVENLAFQIRVLERERLNRYQTNSLLVVPNENNLSHAEKLAIRRRRATQMQAFLNSATRLRDDNRSFRNEFRQDYYRARDNFYFYGARVSVDQSGINASLVPSSIPSPIAEFRYLAHNNFNRFLISKVFLKALIDIGHRLKDIDFNLTLEIKKLKDALKEEKSEIEFEKFFLTLENDGTS